MKPSRPLSWIPLALASLVVPPFAAAQDPGPVDLSALKRAIVLVAPRPSRVMLMYPQDAMPRDDQFDALVTEAACRAYLNVNARYPGQFPLPVTVHIVALAPGTPPSYRPIMPPLLEQQVQNCDDWQPAPEGQET